MIAPGEPTGNTREAEWGRKVVRALRTLDLQPGIGYRVIKTSQGTVLDIYGLAVSGGADVDLTDCLTGRTYSVKGRDTTEEEE